MPTAITIYNNSNNPNPNLYNPYIHRAHQERARFLHFLSITTVAWIPEVLSSFLSSRPGPGACRHPRPPWSSGPAYKSYTWTTQNWPQISQREYKSLQLVGAASECRSTSHHDAVNHDDDDDGDGYFYIRWSYFWSTWGRKVRFNLNQPHFISGVLLLWQMRWGFCCWWCFLSAVNPNSWRTTETSLRFLTVLQILQTPPGESCQRYGGFYDCNQNIWA